MAVAIVFFLFATAATVVGVFLRFGNFATARRLHKRLFIRRILR
jgi:hypothetical protein